MNTFFERTLSQRFREKCKSNSHNDIERKTNVKILAVYSNYESKSASRRKVREKIPNTKILSKMVATVMVIVQEEV